MLKFWLQPLEIGIIVTYEGKGGYSKFIPRFYDAAKPWYPNYKVWSNPYLEANKDAGLMNAGFLP